MIFEILVAFLVSSTLQGGEMAQHFFLGEISGRHSWRPESERGDPRHPPQRSQTLLGASC